jgi:hypothetical protein
MLRRKNSIVAGVGKLLNPSRLRPNLAISASNCGALSGMFGSRDGRKKQEESNVSAGIALTACAKTRLKATG